MSFCSFYFAATDFSVLVWKNKNSCCSVMYCSTPWLAVLSCFFFSALCNVVLSYNVFHWSAVCHAVLCSAVLYTVVLCWATVYTAVLSSMYDCSVQCWPWGAPGAEPGADGSASHAASGTRWLVAASGSAAASEWGAAPAAAASPTALGPNLTPASWDLYAGPTEIKDPQPMARLTWCPLWPAEGKAERIKEK